MSPAPIPGEMRRPTRSAPISAATASTTSAVSRARLTAGSAVDVGALVDDVGQELVQQVAVGGVDLDTVHAGVDRTARRGAELLDDRGDLVGGQRPRHRQRLLARRGVGGHVGGDGRRRDRLHAADVGVRHPADVPQLHEHPAARGVHRVGDLGPLLLMAIGVDARGVEVGAVGRLARSRSPR